MFFFLFQNVFNEITITSKLYLIKLQITFVNTKVLEVRKQHFWFGFTSHQHCKSIQWRFSSITGGGKPE